MTIMVKTNLGEQKQPTEVVVMPLIEVAAPERPANRVRKLVTKPQPPRRRWDSTPNVVFMYGTAVFLTLIGFMCGSLVLRDVIMRYYVPPTNVRYHGSCAISSTKDMDYVVLKEAPPTASWFGVPTAEMKVYSSASDLINSKILNNLLEDMSIEDETETIYVHDGPRSFKVVHDFNENYTNIISAQRCFLMEMIRQFVLEPSSLIASFRNDSALELSHAHTVYSAALPDVAVSTGAVGLRYPSVARPCLADNKPVYRLSLEGTHVLHKRSVEVRTTLPPEVASAAAVVPSVAEPRAGTELNSNDFVQFSGKHLQRITISNLDDVLKYEVDNDRLQAHPKAVAGRAADE